MTSTDCITKILPILVFKDSRLIADAISVRGREHAGH